MKVAILTQPLGSNYGGILQNYALQTVLRSLNHEPVTIYYGHNSLSDWCVLWLRYIAKNILRHPNRKIRPPKYEAFVGRAKTPYLVDFVRERLTLTSPMNKIEYSKFRDCNFGAYIVGSDQIWRPCYNGGELLFNMFLDFLGDASEIKRVAYAASFGVDEWEYNTVQERKCKELLRRFDSVSVREASGVALCRKHFGVEAEHLLDPTLLLTADTYRDVTETVAHDKVKKVAVYVLDMDSDKQALIDGFCSENGAVPVYIGAKEVDGCYPKVEAWLAGIDGADYVITDSFHGSAFSIIFNKPFIAIGNRGRGMDRFRSLFSLLGLEDSLVEATSRPKECPVYDWNSVNALISELREKSIKFLKEGLE